MLATAGLWGGSVAPAPAQNITHGNCSPVVTGVNGDVSIVCNFPDSDAPKFRISYYRVGGVALSFLLDGRLSPEWADRLGGQQAIIDNAVAEEARAFLDRFATEVGGIFPASLAAQLTMAPTTTHRLPTMPRKSTLR